MDAKELFRADGESAGVWYCGHCRNIAGVETVAERCCRCSFCGEPVAERSRTYHPACQAAQRIAHESERRAKAEVLTDYDGWVYCEGWGRDGYLGSLGELLEEIEDDAEEKARPEYAWACKEEPFRQLDAEDCFERVCDDSFDGAYDQLSGKDALVAAVAEFNAANVGLVSYCPDFRSVVLVPATTPAP